MSGTVERGAVIGSMEQLGGEYRLADAKATVPMGPGDINNSITQNAGGYSDRGAPRGAVQGAAGRPDEPVTADFRLTGL